MHLITMVLDSIMVK